MLKSLESLLGNLFGPERGEADTKEQDLRQAAAALLVHACAIDGVIEEVEAAKLQDVLKKRFELSDEDVRALIVAAERREREAVDLYRFTSQLKSNMSEEERLKLIEMMWEIVFADGEIHEFEDNLVWRTAELLGISARERIRLKKKVEAQQ